MAESGATNIQIAAAIGLKSDRQVIRLKREAGVAILSRAKIAPDIRERIRHLSEAEGWPPEEIAATLGISWNAAHENSIRGPGEEWSYTARRLAHKHPRLWRELRGAA